jgi:hypothetical protein
MRILILLLALSLTSCAYHLGDGGVMRDGSSIAIPFVEGDDLGLMTQRLIHDLKSEHRFRLVGDGADYKLKVCLSSPKSSNIGYIYAPQKNGGLSNIIIPNQGRMTLKAKVELIDCVKNCKVLGPQTIETFLDYDFNPDITKINLNQFSLGQLEMNEMAKDAARDSLYNLLSEKIVDLLDSAW